MSQAANSGQYDNVCGVLGTDNIQYDIVDVLQCIFRCQAIYCFDAHPIHVAILYLIYI